MSRPKRGTRHAAVPYLIAAVSGVVLAWLVVVFVIFPIDPDVATPEVPNVVGETFDAAERKLREEGFQAVQGEVRQVKAASRGTVVEQVPASGTRHKAGGEVLLHTTPPPGI